MTIEQFRQSAFIELHAFGESYQQHAQEEPHIYASELDGERWWQEFRAYQNMLVLQDFMLARSSQWSKP